MGEFFQQHWEIATTFIVMLITSVGFLVKTVSNFAVSKGKQVEDKIEKVEERMEEIEHNYNDKFKEVHQKFDVKFEEMMAKLNEIQLTNKDAYNSISNKLDKQILVCEMVQQAKNK